MQYKNVTDLNKAIAELESVKAQQQTELRAHYQTTLHSLNPIHIVKNKFADIKQSIIGPGETRNSILGFASNLALSFLTKKLIVGKSNSKIKKLLGGLVETSSFGFLQGHADEIQAWATAIYHHIVDPKKDTAVYKTENAVS